MSLCYLNGYNYWNIDLNFLTNACLYFNLKRLASFSLSKRIGEKSFWYFLRRRNLADVTNFIKFRHLLGQKRGNWREQTKSWFEKYSPTFDIFPEFNGRDYYFTPQLLLSTLGRCSFPNNFTRTRHFLKFNLYALEQPFSSQFPSIPTTHLSHIAHSFFIPSIIHFHDVSTPFIIVYLA